MEQKKKIMMGLVVASISALSIAPTIMDKVDAKEDGKDNVININEVAVMKNITLTAEQNVLRNEYKNEFESLLSKKTPMLKLGEEIHILVENYGENNTSVKNELFKNLNLAQSADSTGSGSASMATAKPPTQTGATCHVVCHAACHGACHGSRSWR